MMCANTTWFVDKSAFEINAPSRSFSLRKVDGRTALGFQKNILRLRVVQARVSEARPLGRVHPHIHATLTITRALPHGRASDREKGFSRPKPFAVKRYRP